MPSILEALKSLDPANPNHWTEDGMPRMDTVKLLAGDASLTREAVTAAAPGFSRTSLQVKDTPPANAVVAAAPAVVAAAPTPPTNVENPNPPTSGSIEHAGDEGSAGARETDEEPEPLDAKSAARAALQGAQARLVEATKRKEKADQDLAEATQEVDRCLQAVEQSGGGETLAQQLNGYFAAQRKIQQERVLRLQALKGVDLKSILPQRAPIDNAMARKTGRGGQRPTPPKL